MDASLRHLKIESNSAPRSKLRGIHLKIKIKDHSETLKRNYPSWPISIKIRISLLIVNLPLIVAFFNAINSFVSSFH